MSDGYVLETMSQTVTINKSDVQTLTFYNKPDSGLLITKLDKRIGDALYGAVFKITTDDGTVVGNANGRYTTNSSGIINIDGLEDGWYTILEAKAARGYQLDSVPHDVEVKNGKISRVTASLHHSLLRLILQRVKAFTV